jgi:hypothetical protein
MRSPGVINNYRKLKIMWVGVTFSASIAIADFVNIGRFIQTLE